MALEKSDFTAISKFVRDAVARIPPRPISAVGIGKVLGTPEADTPVSSDSSDRLATTAFVKNQFDAVNVMDYGARGDGFTDDTAAIQNAVNAALLPGGGELYFPPGTYHISAAISIPFSTQFLIRGASRGSTILQQSASNTPIFKFTHNLTWGWAIQDISFTASTQQVSTNVQSAGVMVTNNANVFNWIIERCYFDKLANGVYGDAGSVVWGGVMRDIQVNSSQTRSLIQLVAGGGAFPNNVFEHIHFYANSMVGPLFDMAAAQSTWITGVEINNANLGPCIIHDTAGGSYGIGTLKMEVGNYSVSVGGQAFFQLANTTGFVANYILLSSVTANMTGATYPNDSIIRMDSSIGKVRIGRLDLLGWSVTNGQIIVITGVSTGDLDVKIDSLSTLPGNVSLTAIGSDSAVDHFQVSSWNDGQLSADQGDNNVTVIPAPTQPNILSFETVLTAARTVTLISATQAPSILFNGLKYTVRADAGVTAAWPININNGAVLLDTIPVGKSGAIEYTYRRNQWVQTMKALF